MQLSALIIAVAMMPLGVEGEDAPGFSFSVGFAGCFGNGTPVPPANSPATNTQEIDSKVGFIDELTTVWLHLTDTGFISSGGSCGPCLMEISLKLRHDGSSTEIDLWQGTINPFIQPLEEIRFSPTSRSPANSPMGTADMRPAGDFSEFSGLEASGTMSLLFEWTQAPNCTNCDVTYGASYCLGALGTATDQPPTNPNLSLIERTSRVEVSQSVQHLPTEAQLPIIAGKPIHLRVLVSQQGELDPYTVVARLIYGSRPTATCLPYDAILKAPNSTDWGSFINTFNFCFPLDQPEATDLVDIQIEVNPINAPYPLDGNSPLYEAYRRKAEESYEDNLLSLSSAGLMPEIVTSSTPRIGYVFLQNYGVGPSTFAKQDTGRSGDDFFRKLFPVADNRHINAFHDAVQLIDVNPQDVIRDGPVSIRRARFVRWLSRLRDKCDDLDYLYGYFPYDFGMDPAYGAENFKGTSVGIGAVENPSYVYAHELGHWAGASGGISSLFTPFDRNGHSPCDEGCPTPLGIDVYKTLPIPASSDNALMRDDAGSSMTLTEADFFYSSPRFRGKADEAAESSSSILSIFGAVSPSFPNFSELAVYEGIGSRSESVDGALFVLESYSRGTLLTSHGLDIINTPAQSHQDTGPISAGPSFYPLYFSTRIEAVAGQRAVDRIIVRDVASLQVIAEKERSITPPSFSECSAFIQNEMLTVEWQAFDPDGDPLTFEVDYSFDDGVNYSPLCVEFDGKKYLVSLDDLGGTSGAETGVVRVTANDGFNSTSRVVEGLAVPSKPPLVLASSPTPNQQYEFGATTFMSCIASDQEDGELDGNSIEWFSDIDGPLGLGRNTSGILSPGMHVLTVLVRDSDGMEAADTVIIDVSAPLVQGSDSPFAPASRR